jgi:hypothetical protein
MRHLIAVVSALAEILVQLLIELAQLVVEALLDWIFRKRERK